jgi:ribose 1,5-bisphosphokinase PhnN
LIISSFGKGFYNYLYNKVVVWIIVCFNNTMKQFESVYVAGSSGAGKTTMVNGLRTPGFEDLVVIQKRLITRPHRLRDDLDENQHVSRTEFEAMVAAGAVNPVWDRILENGRVESYGFEIPTTVETRLPVLSANNALLRSPDARTKEFLSRGIGVIATALWDIRWARLEERSPDMSPNEKLVRLSDGGIDPSEYPYPLIVVDTSAFGPSDGQREMQHIIRKVVSGEINHDTWQQYQPSDCL